MHERANHLISHNREDRRAKGLERSKQLESLKNLYEEALFVLDRHARRMGRGNHEAFEGMLRLQARLQIEASAGVLRQYHATADALEAWLEKARLAGPEEKVPGLLIFRGGASEHEEEAKSLLQEYRRQLDALGELMVSELNAASHQEK